MVKRNRPRVIEVNGRQVLCLLPPKSERQKEADWRWRLWVARLPEARYHMIAK